MLSEIKPDADRARHGGLKQVQQLERFHLIDVKLPEAMQNYASQEQLWGVAWLE